MSNSSFEKLRLETKKLLSEISGPQSQFVFHAKSILKRYGKDQEFAQELKIMMGDILAAAQENGLDGVNSVSQSSYAEDLGSIVNWMKGKAKTDIRNNVELPFNMDEIMLDIDKHHAAKLEALKKAQEEAAAKAKAEAERKAALSPEDRAKEEDLEKSKREWNQLMAVYGGEENYRSGRGLGS